MTVNNDHSPIVSVYFENGGASGDYHSSRSSASSGSFLFSPDLNPSILQRSIRRSPLSLRTYARDFSDIKYIPAIKNSQLYVYDVLLPDDAWKDEKHTSPSPGKKKSTQLIHPDPYFFHFSASIPKLSPDQTSLTWTVRRELKPYVIWILIPRLERLPAWLPSSSNPSNRFSRLVWLGVRLWV